MENQIAIDDSALTLKEVGWMFLGLGYVVNHRSREIHRISDKHRNCHLGIISKKNSEHVSKREAMKLIKEKGYNGCRWCNEETDKG